MRLTAIFPTMESAHAARRALLDRGIDDACVTLSVSQTEDGIAGEYPGQSYENQPGQPGVRWGRDADIARFTEKVRGGECLLTLDGGTRGDAGRLERLLRESGARHVSVPPDGVA